MSDVKAEEIKAAMAQLDGSARAAVRLMTGFSDEQLTELGGFSDD